MTRKATGKMNFMLNQTILYNTNLQYSKKSNTKMSGKCPIGSISRPHIDRNITHSAGYLYYMQRKDPWRDRVVDQPIDGTVRSQGWFPEVPLTERGYLSGIRAAFTPENDINGNLDNQSLHADSSGDGMRCCSYWPGQGDVCDDKDCIHLPEKVKTIDTSGQL